MMKHKAVIGISTPCIIIPKKTGIIYSNQVGGYACNNLEIEGYIIPLESDFYSQLKEGEKSNCDNPYWNKYNLQKYFDNLFAPLKDKTKYGGHCYKGIDFEDVTYLEIALKNDFLEIEIDRTKLENCQEAMIFVYIKLRQYNQDGNEIEPLHTKGILTWNNSD